MDQADACTVAVPRQSWHRNIHGALVSGQGLQLAAAGALETRLAVVYLMKAGRHRCSLFAVAAMQVATAVALVYQKTREREESQQRKHESVARRMLRGWLPISGRREHGHTSPRSRIAYIRYTCGVDSLELSRDYSHGQLLCVQPAYHIPSVHTAVSRLQQAPSAVASVRSDTTHTKVPSPAHANAGCQSPRAPAKTTGQASAVSALLYTSAKGYFARLERAVSTSRN